MRVNRWTLIRRVVQLAMVALLASPLWSNRLFEGTLASASLLGLPLSDPLAALQVFLLTGAMVGTLAGGALLILLFYFLTGGRSFCGWVCPVQLFTDLLEMIPMARRLPRWPLEGKRVALVLILGLTLLTGLPVFETISPIGISSRALTFGSGTAIIVLGLIAIVELAVVRRIWCRSLCPLGGFYALLGSASPVAVRFREERCTACGACQTVCSVPEVLDPSMEQGCEAVHSGECTRCGACIGVCPDDALRIGLRNPLTHFRSRRKI